MKPGFFSGYRKITSISVGLVYVFFTLWLIFHTAQFVPTSQQDFWYRVFIGYGILNSIIFGNANLRNKLFNVKLLSFIPRFLFFFISGLVIFYFITSFVDPGATGGLLSLLAGVPLWLAVIHSFIFATTESVIWQGYLDEKIGQPWSALTAGFFHFGIWSGGVFFVIIGATLLFLMFSYINWRFKQNRHDLAPAIGTHAAYNIIKLGVFVIGGAAL